MKKPNIKLCTGVFDKAPEDFNAIDQAEVCTLTAGSIVRVGACGEWFYIVVLSVDGDNLTGEVDSELLNTAEHGLRYKDRVGFSTINIQSIYE